MASKQQVLMQLSDDQIENIRGIFHHFDWDFDSAVISDSSFLVDVETQTDSQDHTEEINDNDEEVNQHFRIQQDPNSTECIYCFCRPCITNEVIGSCGGKLTLIQNTEEIEIYVKKYTKDFGQ